MLVLGGEDTLLSELAQTGVVDLARKFFPRIFVEGYDVEIPGVDIMPIGFTEYYLRGKYAQLLASKRKALPPLDHGRSINILASWGRFWPALDSKIPDRIGAHEFATSSRNVLYLRSSSEDYFRKLADSKFFMAPLGNGAQSPKIIEGIYLGAIPIMTDSPTSRALVAKDFPIVVVQSWKEIDQSLGISPRRRGELKSKLEKVRSALSNLDDYWLISFGSGQGPSDGSSIPN